MIDGAFSHAGLKRPQTGEFRVHSRYQGQHARISPPEPIVAQAQAVVQGLCTMPLFARVDGVLRGEKPFCLIELEINEPDLYVQHAPEQARMLANAVDAKRSQ